MELEDLISKFDKLRTNEMNRLFQSFLSKPFSIENAISLLKSFMVIFGSRDAMNYAEKYIKHKHVSSLIN